MRVIGSAAPRPDNIERVIALAPTRFPPVAAVSSYRMNVTDKRDFFGWTADLPGRVRAPTLVIRGARDDQAPELATRALYDALGGPKVYVTVSCGSHELVYEKQHTKLMQASAEWLRSRSYEGRSPRPASK
jgi:pimeloyl-ACP methyl ester carboxylesterase